MHQSLFPSFELPSSIPSSGCVFFFSLPVLFYLFFILLIILLTRLHLFLMLSRFLFSTSASYYSSFLCPCSPPFFPPLSLSPDCYSSPPPPPPLSLHPLLLLLFFLSFPRGEPMCASCCSKGSAGVDRASLTGMR